MNNQLKILGFILCGFMISCQDNMDEFTSAPSEPAVTRAENPVEASDFYWYRGEKIYLRKVLDKSYVMFKSKNENVLISSLDKSMIVIDCFNN